MKIAFFSGGMGAGGAERVISILANHFDSMGWNVDICVLLNTLVQYKLHDNIRIVDITSKKHSYYLNTPDWLIRIRHYLIIHKPDIVISFIGRINALVLTAGIGLKIPIIVSERNDPHRDGRNCATRLICDMLYRRAAMVVFQTKYQRDCFSDAVKKHSCIIPNPVSVSHKTDYRDNFRIVTVGRLCPQKNQSMLIRSIALINNDYPDVKVDIYGEGPLKEYLENQVKKYDLDRVVQLKGCIAEIHKSICSATIFVLTSDYEGTPNALIEAMMLGIPCICTDFPGANEIIKNGINGLIVPRQDPLALANALKKMFDNYLLYNSIIQNLPKSVVQYQVSNVVKVWNKLLVQYTNKF